MCRSVRAAAIQPLIRAECSLYQRYGENSATVHRSKTAIYHLYMEISGIRRHFHQRLLIKNAGKPKYTNAPPILVCMFLVFPLDSYLHRPRKQKPTSQTHMMSLFCIAYFTCICHRLLCDRDFYGSSTIEFVVTYNTIAAVVF